MLKLIIEDDEGRKTVVPFVREEITIGRQEGNTIRLTERNVSRRHARLVRQNGHVLVEDLGSYNGIRLNGEKIAGQMQVHSGDLIQIGDYDLAIQDEVPAQAGAPQPAAPQLTPVPPQLGAAPAEGSGRAHAAVAEGPALKPGTPVLEALPEEVEKPAPAPDRAHQSTAVIHMDQVEEGATRAPVQDIDPAEAPRLVVLNTDYGGREFACIRTELRLGRTDENDIAIDHRSMSRSHAKLLRDANGEWSVVDLQSANGVRVNGEQYARVALAPGDVLELGHVKLKFLAPGQAFRYVPGEHEGEGEGEPKKGGGAKGVLLVAVAATALVAIGALAFALTRPAGPTNVKTAVAPANPTPGSAQPGPTTAPPETAASDLEPKLKAARAAMDERDFEKAIQLLDPIVDAKGAHPKPVADLIGEARSELAAKQDLTEAQRAIEESKLDEAAHLLGKAQGTLSYAREYERLKAKLDAERAKAEAAANKPPTPAGPTPAELAQKALDDGVALLKKKQYAQARDVLLSCLKQDASMARCHMYLGSAYAKLRDLETAAKHYRQFVQKAPGDPLAPKVREMLLEFEKTKP